MDEQDDKMISPKTAPIDSENGTYSPKSRFTPIRDWKSDDKPRERLMMHGPEVLSDSELLAIIVGSGTVGRSAIDIARELLKKYSSLNHLARCDFSEFKNISGIGDAKAVSIIAAFELSRRIEIAPFSGKKIFRSPEEIAEYYIPRMRDLRIEIFKVLLLTSSNQIFRDLTITEGILNSSVVHPREVFRIAITESAAAIILMHNHPSGNPEPSKEDIKITEQIVQAGKIVGIKVLDHIIIAGDKFTSFVSLGLI
ncbi:MAG: DNA repair protein RadC [Candidatus Kapabacteria bacterium]|nr:DNA repair protein RadC [Candidatus Kapabacteria bacterium]